MKRSIYRPDKTYNLHGITGTGKTDKEARADAIAKLEAATSYPYGYAPFLHLYRSKIGLIWRDLEGYTYNIIETNTLSGRTFRPQRNSWGQSDQSFEDTKKRMLMALAQLAWECGDGVSVPPFLTKAEDVCEFKQWCRFQLHYQRLREEGNLSDVEIHKLASELSYQPMPDEEVQE